MAGTESNHKISTLEISWAAGFLEGEGSFYNFGSPQVTAAQVQREPIQKLVRLFGGHSFQRKTKGFSEQPIWVWKLGSHRSVEVMMTLYVLMSPKRQLEIAEALRVWKTARLMKRPGSAHCARGHALAGDNIRISNGYRRCRQCERLRSAINKRGGSARHVYSSEDR